MTTKLEIRNLEMHLQDLKSKISLERLGNVIAFEKKLNELISKTTTGELRNELTELNILFIAIMVTV